MKVLIIGSTGRLGKLIVEYALEKGIAVRAFARNIEDLSIDHPALEKVQGDVLYPALVEAPMKGVDAVVSVIGIRQFSGPISLLSTGIRNVVNAMENQGAKRLITITGAGILQENEDELIMESLSFPPNLQNISLDHYRVLKILRTSALDWTIVAPAFMNNAQRTANYITQADYYPRKSQNQVSIQDVADFIVKELLENNFVQKRVGIANPI